MGAYLGPDRLAIFWKIKYPIHKGISLILGSITTAKTSKSKFAAHILFNKPSAKSCQQ